MTHRRGYLQRAQWPHWVGGGIAALGLHLLALVIVALSAVKPLPMLSEPVEIEFWRIPQAQPEPLVSEDTKTPEAATMAQAPQTDRPTPAPEPEPLTPRTARAVQTDDVLPIAPKPAPDTAAAVTPKAYDAGGDKGRAALTQALLKREACLEQRRLGKPLDKDCALGEAPDNLVLGVQPPEKRPTKLCIAARERTWQKYREGRAAYPGIMDALRGNKDCRKDWD